MKSNEVFIHFLDYGNIGLSGNEEALALIKEKYTYMSEGYNFLPPQRKKYWDGKITIAKFDRSNNCWKYGIGLKNEIISHLEASGFEVKLDWRLKNESVLTREEFDDWVSKLDIKIKGKTITPYDFQIKSVWSWATKIRNMLISPTSSGKTMIANLCCKLYYDLISTDPRNDKVLYIVPSKSLVEQGYKDFIDYGCFDKKDLARIHGESKDDTVSTRIHFATWQTLNNKPPEFFDQYNILFNDESHNAKSPVMQKIIDILSHCKYRMGMTGTLTSDRDDQSIDAIKIRAILGDVVQFVTTRELIERGIVTDVRIHMISLQHTEETIKELYKLRQENKKKRVTKAELKELGIELEEGETINNDYMLELDLLLNQEKRMDVISGITKSAVNKNENTFIMFRFKEHGKAIYERIKADGVTPHVFYIDGDTKIEERNRIIELLEVLNGAVIVAVDKIFSTGISINNLPNIIMASPNKTQITVIQAVGRILRLHEDKNIAKVFDLVDNASPLNKNGEYIKARKNYCLEHGEIRATHYQAHEYYMSFSELKL